MTPPLFRLPAELLLDIVDRIELQDRVRLSLVNRQLNSFLLQPTYEELLQAETKPWAMTRNLFVCKACVRLRRLLQFADDMRKGKRVKGGPEASKRFCVECGLSGLYQPGTECSIMGQPYVFCRCCKTFTDDVGSAGHCDTCLPQSRTLQCYNAGSAEHSDSDDWPYSAALRVNDRNQEAIYEAWKGW